jgi:hypothetical protein
MGSAQSLTIPASHGMPEVRVSLVKEGNDWKLSVPSTLTPERLQSNLSRELTRVNEEKSQWPTDATEAQRAVAHHVMLAIMDQDSQQNGANHGAAGSGTDRNSSRTGSGTSGSGTTGSGTSGSGTSGSGSTGTGGSSTGTRGGSSTGGSGGSNR